MIHIKRAKNRQFYFIVKAKNGRTLVTSEQYKRKESCINGMRALLETINVQKIQYFFKDVTGDKK